MIIETYPLETIIHNLIIMISGFISGFLICISLMDR